jgi:hypothetical protein
LSICVFVGWDFKNKNKNNNNNNFWVGLFLKIKKKNFPTLTHKLLQTCSSSD